MGHWVMGAFRDHTSGCTARPHQSLCDLAMSLSLHFLPHKMGITIPCRVFVGFNKTWVDVGI